MTESDTPSQEPGTLNADSAALAFENLLDPPKDDAEPKVDTEVDTPEKPEPEAKSNAQAEGDEASFTIEVDGKQVTLTKAELAEAYKNGLRQSDYTQKTMAVAEQRKAADAEVQKTLQERHNYVSGLQKVAAQLEGAIQQHSKVDMAALIASDPVEALRQMHLSKEWQAQLTQNQQEQYRIQQQAQAEQAEASRTHLRTQQDELLAKLPEWKDEAKAKAERESLKEYLSKQGYEDKDIAAIQDHRAVILSRKAMLYDQMVAKASAAAKKVQNLPTKVERPGVSETSTDIDGRSAVMRRHAKEGSIDSLAQAFASIL